MSGGWVLLFAAPPGGPQEPIELWKRDFHVSFPAPHWPKGVCLPPAHPLFLSSTEPAVNGYVSIPDCPGMVHAVKTKAADLQLGAMMSDRSWMLPRQTRR